MTGLEPAASCSQSRRATTCATPRYFYFNFFLISLFSSLLCPPSCGSRNLFGSIVSSTFRPLRLKTLAFSATGSAHVFAQSRRATTCAAPRYFYINFFLVSLFSSLLCPLPCGSRNLFGSIVSLDIPTAAPKNARFFCHRQRSRFLPKAGALPPALHLDTAIIRIQL